MNKNGSISWPSVIILGISAVLLAVILWMVTAKLVKMSSSFESSVENEPRPATPDALSPFTLSRYSIETSKSFEVLKASVFNPTEEEWAIRNYWGSYSKGCGQEDGICLVAQGCDLPDADCAKATKNAGDICYVENDDDSDADCAPTEIKVTVECTELGLRASSASKNIPPKDYETFIIILDIPKSAQKNKLYTCTAKLVHFSKQNIEKQLTVFLLPEEK